MGKDGAEGGAGMARFKGGPKKRCSPEQLKMIDAFMAGASKKDAFALAFPERAARNKDPYSIATNEFAKPLVKEEVERREAARENAINDAAMSEAEHIASLWSREDSVRRLIEIADDCQRARIAAQEAEDEDFPVMTARLERDTVDSLNKMLGYDAPVKIDQDQHIHVVFDGGDDSEDWTG